MHYSKLISTFSFHLNIVLKSSTWRYCSDEQHHIRLHKLSPEDQRVKLKALEPQIVHIHFIIGEDPTIDIDSSFSSYMDGLTPESLDVVLETYIWNNFRETACLFNPTKDFLFPHFPILAKKIGESYRGDYPNPHNTNNTTLDTIVEDHLSHLALLMPGFENITAQRMVLDFEYVVNYFPFFVSDAAIVPPVKGMSSLHFDAQRMFSEDENRGSTSYTHLRRMLKHNYECDIKEISILLQKAMTKKGMDAEVVLLQGKIQAGLLFLFPFSIYHKL